MQFFSLNIYSGKYRDFLESIKNPNKKTLVFTPNPEILLRASRDENFLNLLRQADYLTPDANGLYTARLIEQGKGYIESLFLTLFSRKKLRKEFGEIISGSALTRDLVDLAHRSGERILIIDNYRIVTPTNPFEIQKQKIQQQYPSLLQNHFPGLDVSIFYDGESSSEIIAQVIQEKDIRYVFSCIGMKRQEERLIEIFSYLPSHQRVVGLGVGSSLDYLLGLQKRAPSIIQQLGFEWLYRLILNPRARYMRILDAVWRFPMMIKKSQSK